MVAISQSEGQPQGHQTLLTQKNVMKCFKKDIIKVI